MPLLKIISNTDIADKNAFIGQSSKEIARILGKTEKYVMVIFTFNPNFIFSTSDEPALYVELKSIGLPTEKTGEISRKIIDFLSSKTGVIQSRIFIEFTDVPPNLWGWNGGTM
ncbi:MAG TPA: phenylpyruvate tautomerase MIF-related protein [Bacteroidales bacterium]|nr:phenylpyruvate tautomerase MIF-related protein [Bacteroidales bacterium]HQO06723.1 phenylpyruvate tautomerase MIF-related protein [Bacteroidales bacterium]HQP52609.1 phenylpyruvate tautomerase MIF-related protein [Bacteroidales bacterium]